jgi:ABC-type branched-subunit amino acid transport system substrate-binding protein
MMAPIALRRRWKNRLPTPALNTPASENKRDGGKFSLRLSVVLSCCLVVLLTACTASTQPVIRIGLVAPFEGRYRAIGYEAIYAARLAIREINAQGGIHGQRIELVALDDQGEPERAITTAQQLVLDPQVVAVIGHFQPDSTDAAQAIYCSAGLPVLAIETARAPCEGAFALGAAARDRWLADQLIFVSDVPDPNSLAPAKEFVMTYNAIPIDGTRAGPIALQTYDAMELLFDVFRRAALTDRGGVRAALATGHFNGLGASYAFDPQGRLIDPQVAVFEYDLNHQPHLIP